MGHHALFNVTQDIAWLENLMDVLLVNWWATNRVLHRAVFGLMHSP